MSILRASVIVIPSGRGRGQEFVRYHAVSGDTSIWCHQSNRSFCNLAEYHCASSIKARVRYQISGVRWVAQISRWTQSSPIFGTRSSMSRQPVRNLLHPKLNHSNSISSADNCDNYDIWSTDCSPIAPPAPRVALPSPSPTPSTPPALLCNALGMGRIPLRRGAISVSSASAGATLAISVNSIAIPERIVANNARSDGRYEANKRRMGPVMVPCRVNDHVPFSIFTATEQ